MIIGPRKRRQAENGSLIVCTKVFIAFVVVVVFCLFVLFVGVAVAVVLVVVVVLATAAPIKGSFY